MPADPARSRVAADAALRRLVVVAGGAATKATRPAAVPLAFARFLTCAEEGEDR